VWLWDIDPSENNIEDYIDTPIAFIEVMGVFCFLIGGNSVYEEGR